MGRIVLLFFHRVVRVESVFMLFPLIMLLQDFRPEVLRNLPKIGKDPRSGGEALVRENSIFAVVCLSEKSPDFSGRESPISIRNFPDGIDQDCKQKITKETKILLRPRQNNFVLRCLFNLLLLLFLGQSPYLSLSSSPKAFGADPP